MSSSRTAVGAPVAMPRVTLLSGALAAVAQLACGAARAPAPEHGAVTTDSVTPSASNAAPSASSTAPGASSSAAPTAVSTARATTSSPAASSPAASSPAASNGAPEFTPEALDFLAREERSYRETAPEVERELEHFHASYAVLPPLGRVPDFLSLNAVLTLHPQAEGEGLRERIHEQLGRVTEHASDVDLHSADLHSAPLRGATLDDEGNLTLLWVHGSLTQVLASYYRERLVSRVVVQRGQPFLAEVLSEEGAPRSELLVRSITSMSVCCLPESLLVYRVGQRGELRQVLSFERGYSEVGPGVRWGFLNHFEFDAEARRVLVTRVYPEPNVAEQASRWELHFDERAGKYRPLRGSPKLPTAKPRSSKLEDPEL